MQLPPSPRGVKDYVELLPCGQRDGNASPPRLQSSGGSDLAFCRERVCDT